MKKENMNNKGFSLVELIVVIAIMAVLIVVLAPQYLRYVERSRNSTDLQNVRTVMTAVETYAADPQAALALGSAEFVFTVNNTQISASGDNAADQALKDAGLVQTFPSQDIKCSSKSKWDSYKIKGKLQSNGGIKWDYESYKSPTASDNGELKKAMKGNT